MNSKYFALLSIALIFTGCLSNKQNVTSGSIAVIPPLTRSADGTIVPANNSAPTVPVAHLAYAGNFYDYNNVVPNILQTFAFGDGGLVLYGTNFVNDSATQVIFRNVNAPSIQVVLPASEFTISDYKIVMKSPFKLPSAADLQSAVGAYEIFVKNANGVESDPLEISMISRPSIEFSNVTAATLTGPVSGVYTIVSTANDSASSSFLFSSNSSIAPPSRIFQVKNLGNVSITLSQLSIMNGANFLLPAGNNTVPQSADFKFASYGGSLGGFCAAGKTLAPGDVCLFTVEMINTSSNVYQCTNFSGTFGVSFSDNSGFANMTSVISLHGENGSLISCGVTSVYQGPVNTNTTQVGASGISFSGAGANVSYPVNTGGGSGAL